MTIMTTTARQIVLLCLAWYQSATAFSLRSTFSTTRSSALTMTATTPNLADRVAIVTGATRGIGKGIALELGAAGATVYVVGRSSRKTGISTERDVGATDCTVERTCEQIDALGGTGVPVVMDIQDEDAIEALVRRVETKGRLDALICSAYTTPPNLNTSEFRSEFWKQGGDMWDAIHNVGLRGMYMMAKEAIPLMIQTAAADGGGQTDDMDAQPLKKRPLIALISSFGGKSYTFNVAYGVGKAATDRLALDMSYQLEKYDVDTVALYPGIVQTEGNLEMEKRGEWDEASGGLDLSMGESPQFSGRAIVQLLSNPALMQERSGQVVVVSELAKELGFTDIDGSIPPSIRSLKFILPSFVFPQIEKESGKPVPEFIANNIPDFLLPWRVFSGGPPPTAD